MACSADCITQIMISTDVETRISVQTMPSDGRKVWSIVTDITSDMKSIKANPCMLCMG